MRASALSLLVFWCAVVNVQSLYAEDEPKQERSRCIAILDPACRDDAPMREGVGQAVGDLLTLYLSAGDGVRVVERSQLAQILAETELASAGWQGIAAAPAMRLLGANTLCAGSFGIRENQLSIHLRVVDTETSAILGTPSVTGALGDLEHSCMALAAQIGSLLRETPTSALPERIDYSPLAGVHFARGLALFWGNEYSQAACEFLTTRQLDAEYPGAGFWLAKAFAGQGLYADALLDIEGLDSTAATQVYAAEASTLAVECRKHLSPEDVSVLRGVRGSRRAGGEDGT